jgi:hypothetical protein
MSSLSNGETRLYTPFWNTALEALEPINFKHLIRITEAPGSDPKTLLDQKWDVNKLGPLSLAY